MSIHYRNHNGKKVVQVGRRHRLKLLDPIEVSNLDRKSISLLFHSDKFYLLSITGNMSLYKLGVRQGTSNIVHCSKYTKVYHLGKLHMLLCLG